MIKLFSYKECRNGWIDTNQYMWYSISSKSETNRIISIDAEKASDKIKHSFMNKSPENLELEWLCLYITKPIHDKHNRHYSERSKTENISSKIRNERMMSTLTSLIKHCLCNSIYFAIENLDGTGISLAVNFGFCFHFQNVLNWPGS
jgi:hypothetical protein